MGISVVGMSWTQMFYYVFIMVIMLFTNVIYSSILCSFHVIEFKSEYGMS